MSHLAPDVRNHRNAAGRCGPPWRSALLGLAAAVFAGSSMAQTPITAYGYFRATLPGIPGSAGDQKPGLGREVFAPEYHIFVAVKPGSQVVAEWARAEEKPTTAPSARSVPGDRQQRRSGEDGQEGTLVPKTSEDVYKVVFGALSHSGVQQGGANLAASNEAVVALVLDNAPAYATVRSIIALRPAAAM